jgi:competence protein ComEA
MGKALIAKLLPHLSFGGVPAEAQVTSVPDPVDINRAGVPDLVGLPGIGAVRARAIIAFRDSVGPFRQLDDLKRVPGITAAIVRRLDGRVVVP